MKVKDTINYSDKVPDILSAQELADSVDKKIEYFYRYKAHYYWIDPYDCGDTGYYLIAYANDITKLQDYCHSKGYDKNVDVHCIGGYEIVDIKKSFQKGQNFCNKKVAFLPMEIYGDERRFFITETTLDVILFDIKRVTILGSYEN